MSKHGETVKFVLCHGCKTTLKDHAVLERHQEDGLCHEFSKSPTEDDGFELGITDDVAAKLRGRGAVSRVMDWESLWLTLFPNDTYIPPPSMYVFFLFFFFLFLCVCFAVGLIITS